jgi:hypothetical protein
VHFVGIGPKSSQENWFGQSAASAREWLPVVERVTTSPSP